MTAYTRTITLDKPLLAGDSLTITVSAPAIVIATPPPPPPPPLPPSGIKNVVVTCSPTSATIAWDVTPAATGQIRFGPTAAYGKVSGLEPSLLGHHVQTLSGLLPGTTYHFAIVSGTTSPDATFTTCWAP